MTKEQINKIKESAMKNARVSMALDGKKISDVDFEKIKRIASRLEKVI